ncbi:MAG TPA: hypothetical protein VHV47_15690 [Opitutaceae bacterium]|jgi:hypothetical protein|nr:hypothetical protein [Opitutaceae bacterium]
MAQAIFTMSKLGRHGRFANQLFQYLFVRLCAEQRGAAVRTPAWVGREIFGIADPALGDFTATRAIAEADIADPDLYLNGAEALGDQVDFCGYFQFHSRHYRPHRDLIRRLCTFQPALREMFGEVVTQLRDTGRPIVAVHLRRGDYGYGHFFRAPARWYAEWLETIAPQHPNALVYLCSEAPQLLTQYFPRHQVLHSGLLPQLPPAVAFLLDFHVMSQADALAISNSSFSFLAAMLNERAATFVRPRLGERDLASFDPWDAPVLLERALRPGEQAQLDLIEEGLPVSA